MPMTEAFDPAAYWEQRLSDAYTLGSVGWTGLGESFNRWMYAVRGSVFKRLVRDVAGDVSGARVLDVGSGTGFYLRRWRELGVRDLSGSDLTATAVERLSAAFPDVDVRQIDIGGDADALPQGEYDIVSVIDVLYHIVDDERYSQALRNLARMAKPGGLVLLSENFLDEPIEAVHQVSRSRAHLERALTDAGLTVAVCRPMFFLMNTPVDSRSRLLHLWWSTVLKVCPRSEALGWLLGAVLYPLELLLLRFSRRGPSSKIVACGRAA